MYIYICILHSINMNLIYVSLQPLEDHPPSGRLSLWPVLPGFLRKLWVCYHNHIYIYVCMIILILYIHVYYSPVF